MPERYTAVRSQSAPEELTYKEIAEECRKANIGKTEGQREKRRERIKRLLDKGRFSGPSGAIEVFSLFEWRGASGHQ